VLRRSRSPSTRTASSGRSSITRPDAISAANAKILGPYSPDAIGDLKARVDGDQYVSGSATLVRAMLAEALVDALHLFVFPMALGAGLRLFAEGGGQMTATWCT
jgi:dihydrofolate reductase